MVLFTGADKSKMYEYLEVTTHAIISCVAVLITSMNTSASARAARRPISYLK
jgi:hypothetical protein